MPRARKIDYLICSHLEEKKKGDIDPDRSKVQTALYLWNITVNYTWCLRPHYIGKTFFLFQTHTKIQYFPHKIESSTFFLQLFCEENHSELQPANANLRNEEISYQSIFLTKCNLHFYRHFVKKTIPNDNPQTPIWEMKKF